MVKSLTPDAKKGKIYVSTDYGKEILEKALNYS